MFSSSSVVAQYMVQYGQCPDFGRLLGFSDNGPGGAISMITTFDLSKSRLSLLDIVGIPSELVVIDGIPSITMMESSMGSRLDPVYYYDEVSKVVGTLCPVGKQWL